MNYIYKKLLILLPFLLFAVNIGSSIAQNCSKENAEYIRYKYKRPLNEDAYIFGLKLQEIVRERDLTKLFTLINRKRYDGPRKKYVQDKEFSEIFSDKWVKSILKNRPSCVSNVVKGTGEFTLGGGDGRILYYGHGIKNGNYKIEKIYGSILEKFDPVPVGWMHEGNTLSPKCFPIMWASSDNYQGFAKYFSIDEVAFSSNPGRYFGKEIPSLDSIDLWGRKVSLTREVDKCQDLQHQLLIRDEYIVYGEESDYIIAYKLLSKVSTDHCQTLALNLNGKCLESYAMAINDGGSNEYTIYGLFKMENNRQFILPLKRFWPKENDLRDYLDTIKLNNY